MRKFEKILDKLLGEPALSRKSRQHYSKLDAEVNSVTIPEQLLSEI